jgi:3-hydroxy acid dehydrogenase / malonic semialdehyde reductase
VKTAVVTGATGGIGQFVVERLTREDYRVVATGTRQAQLNELRRRTGCETLELDICDPAQTNDTLSALEVDIIIHAAGILGPQAATYETPAETVSTILSVNIIGTLNVLRGTIPSMLRRGEGTVVLLGSICGNVAGSGPGVYSASKAALQSIASNLRFELRGSGIRISEIRLGRVRTGIHDQLQGGADLYDGYDCILPENVADTVLHVVQSPANVDLSTIEMMPTRQVVGGTFFSKT